MRPGRVIVTYGRSLMSLVIAQSLSRRGVEVIGCDDVDLTVLSFSRYVDDTFRHASPEDGEDAYIDSLLENIKRLKPEDERPYILMPVFRNTRIIARHKDKISPHITVAAPDWESISKIFPKENLAITAKESRANAPKSLFTSDPNELKEMIKGFQPPVMIKPVDGVGGRGIKSFDSLEEAERAHAAFIKRHGKAPLLQEQVEGDDYCFTGLFKDGELLSHMAYRNVKSFPRKTGAGAIRETVDDGVFVEPAQRLMRETGWTGVAEIDFLWSGEDSDNPYIIEVNPRFWAGLFHSVKSGVDFPWRLYELFATGKVSHVDEATVGETTKAPGLWLASTAQEIAESDLDFTRLRKAWDPRKNDGFLKRLKKTAGALQGVVDLDDACFRLLDAMDLAKNSSDEFAEHDDPLAGLGCLFVLSSIARHGRLPEEVKFS
ncbi:MAG: ATP-grasp domain-containing protein [Pseudomonadota bacterium]